MTQTLPAKSGFTEAQLQIIRKTCAPDTNNDEFNLFIESARLYGLNPMKRQIMAMVFSKNDASKRRMSLIVEIGGLRSIAARSRRYRPASEPTQFEYGAEKTDTNPLGISRAVVTCYKQDDAGEWFPVVGEAWWDEHVNTKDKWAKDPETGRNYKTGEQDLADAWKRMPRLMIAKCAEAQALRRGWPEDVGGLYEEAEGDYYDDNLTPTEALEAKEAKDRSERIGRAKGEYAIQFDMGGAIEMIAPGQMHERIDGWLNSAETTMEILDFKARNAESLKRYWADHKDEALDLNKKMETKLSALKADANKAQLEETT
ncbi:phage recombination protein Bet [Henriciella aquimarina]|uniref:phage recombination protein Bet n=1 Tax=Henriciella aquimarina TaxID=545261 RepID=UPI0009FB9A2E|nr:phage recombination protein Bet [Henriciella aquimarina]